MAELLTSRTLFPGTDHIDQLTRILWLCGKPEEEFLTKVSSEEARNYIRSLPPMKRKDFKQVFKGASPLAIDLLEKTLELDADKRINAEEALAHAYLAQYADPSDEPISPAYDQSFEDMDLSVEEWKELVYKEVIGFVEATIGDAPTDGRSNRCPTSRHISNLLFFILFSFLQSFIDFIDYV